MSFPDYDDFLAMAKELITENGEVCTWGRPVVAASSEPWNPTNDNPLTWPNISICWEPSVIRNFQAFGYSPVEEVADGFLFGLMAGDVPFVPQLSDTITRSDGSILNFIAPADVTGPDGRPVMYTLRATK